jgi:hypothetical protein
VLAEISTIEMVRQALHVALTPEDWAYLLTHAGRTAEILERKGRDVGHICCRAEGGTLAVSDAGLCDPADAPAVLSLLAGKGSASLAICGNSAHTLCGAALKLGGKPGIPDQWLIRIPDRARLLRRTAPVLEKRLAAGGMTGVDAELTLNLYQAALRMVIRGGRIVDVSDVGFRDASLGADGGDLCIPPDAFTRLVLGYRDIDQLRDAWPDIWVKPQARALVETLFPRRDSLVLMPY